MDVGNAVIEQWATSNDKPCGVRAEVPCVPIGSGCNFTIALMQE
jgi:hypothetical protein